MPYNWSHHCTKQWTHTPAGISHCNHGSLYKLPTKKAKSQKKIALENLSSNVHHRNSPSQKERNYLHEVKVDNVILLLVVTYTIHLWFLQYNIRFSARFIILQSSSSDSLGCDSEVLYGLISQEFRICVENFSLLLPYCYNIVLESHKNIPPSSCCSLGSFVQYIPW
jgi:hypothetical protein